MDATLPGRGGELKLLREKLTAALAGDSSLVVVGGPAGIGKSTLVRQLLREAAGRGVVTLTGGCYDLTATPPYGPWREALAQAPSMEQSLPLATAREALAGVPGAASITDQSQLFAVVSNALVALTTNQPLVLVLEDLHWADQGSLDLLRYVSRYIATGRLLLISTYRADELTRRHPLFAVLPLLVREAQAERIDLVPLDHAAVRSLVAERYALGDTDARRLVDCLQAQAEGNPLFLTEVLRTLEAERLLHLEDSGWIVGDLTHIPVPPLIRQVIEQRLNRLSEPTRTLLDHAAVIGHVVPIDTWQLVTRVDEESLLASIDEALDAQLLEASADGSCVQFAHALIREAMYERLLPRRRRARHRHIGEMLAATGQADPDAVAYHFQQAGDLRAVDWLVKAGERAQRAYAWAVTAERFDAATRLLEGDSTRDRERAWLLHQQGLALRWIDPTRGVGYLDEAARVAERAGDRAIAASARAYHGVLLCFIGHQRMGLPLIEQAVAEWDGLDLGERHTISAGVNPAKGALALWLSRVGRLQESMAHAESALAELVQHGFDDSAFESADVQPWDPTAVAGTQAGCSYLALSRVLTLMGRPDEAQAMFERGDRVLLGLGHYGMVYNLRSAQFSELTLTCWCDLIQERELRANATAASWKLAQGAMRAPSSARVTRLPLLVIEGDWGDIGALIQQYRQSHPNRATQLRAVVALAAVARAQGDDALAWEQIRTVLPDGPAHEPGATEFVDAALAQRLAAALALDSGDMSLARAWLEAADRWLSWSGGVVGQAETALLWARYIDASGDPVDAHARAEQALHLADSPRQPLVLLAAHRTLALFASRQGRFTDADQHLAEAVALAGRCAAPFERLLTLLAQGEHWLATRDADVVRGVLTTARELANSLNARPSLARIEQLERRLSTLPPQLQAPLRLSPRERDVLRLLVNGQSNQEIARALFISPNTAANHVANIMNKLGLSSRTAVAVWAARYGIE